MADRKEETKKVHTEDIDIARTPSSTGSNLPKVEYIETNEDVHLTLKESLRKWRRVVYFSLGITTAILMYGYDSVIIGTISAMPSFQHDFGTYLQLEEKWILPSLWLGLWNFISPGCAMIGAIAGGFFQDRHGRRSSLALGSFLSAVGVAICFVSNQSSVIDRRRGIFFAGKGFQGGAIGMVMATAQTYMSEILPPNLRGPLLAFFPIFTLLGQVIGALVIFACLNLEHGYTIAFATQWPLSILPIVMAFVVPESPTYLIRRGSDEKALKSQIRLDGEGNLAQSRSTLQRIKINIEKEKTMAQATYQDSFRKGNLRRTLMVMFAALIPQLFGLTLLAKASYFIQVVGMKANMSVIILILGIVCGLVANIASMWFLGRFDRRVLIMGGLSIAALLWGSMGIAGIWSGDVVVWYSATVMILVIVICGLGCWPSSYAVGSEVSSLDLRAKAQGIGWFTGGAANAIFGFVLPYIFNPDQGDLRAKTGFVFAGLCVIGAVVTFFFVPEMKNRTPAEIDHMFELNLTARQFKGWKNESTPRSQEEKTDSNI